MAIQEGFDKNSYAFEIDFTQTEVLVHHHHAVEEVLRPSGSILFEVEADVDVRILVHNMMELIEGTTILQIAVECQKVFQQKYFSMKTNDWCHLLCDYVRKVTERPELQETEVFRYVIAG